VCFDRCGCACRCAPTKDCRLSCALALRAVRPPCMCSQANNIMPLLVCTVVAYSVAGCFTVSLYGESR
jgi:hypothetical protein